MSRVCFPCSVVFAADEAGGIGKDGGLPWNLPGDLQRFKAVTTKPSGSKVPEGKKNVCIMGRKTWESIPAKYRPLAGRVCLVLSKTLTEADVRSSLPEDKDKEAVHVLDGGLEDALEYVASNEMLPKVDKVFVIGGASLIQHALSSPALHNVHLTRVSGNFACDVAVDLQPLSRFVKSPAEAQDGDGYRFEDYHAPNKEERQYLDAVEDIIETGVKKGDRTGVGTISKFGMQMRYSLRDGRMPLLTTKRVFWKGVAEELFWFIKGCTDGKVLKEKGVGIWDDNGTRAFLDSRGLQGNEEGDLGPIYGFQWRHFGAEYTDCRADYTGKGKDQLAEVIDKIKNNPNDRRIIMSAWNPLALEKMALPPCHVMCQFYVANGELSCQMYQRSCDMGLGVPFNIASYSLLTVLIAHVCGLKPGDFVHTLGDAHVYSNHVEPLREQLKREPRPFPFLKIKNKHDNIEEYSMEDLELLAYKPYPTIKMEMAV